MSLIAVKGLALTRSNSVFAGLGFSIAKGDRLGLVAANGRGKSSLLRIMAGEDGATMGTVTRTRGLVVGFAPQDPPHIDALNERLSPLTSFVLPGGTPAAAHLHVARTICRRAERMIAELAGRPDEPVSEAAIRYMNRLSDFLFVASRAANRNGAGDVLWVPGQNR